jgi:energy-coupling factor transporter transmembrane protein EcfT
MQVIIEAIQNTPIPTLLIVVGLIFIFLGIATKIHIIEVPSQQRVWSIYLGIFILIIGLFLNYYTTQEFDKNPGNDSPGNDIIYYTNSSEKDCIKRCKNNKECVAVVTSPQGECWLKSRLNYPLNQNLNRTVIKVRPS